MGGCGQDDFVRWIAEIAVILNNCVGSINDHASDGFQHSPSDITQYQSLIGILIIDIDTSFWWFVNECYPRECSLD